MTDGRVFWITGLSGSGKTTVAHLLRDWFMKHGIHPVLLDGDAVRELLLPPAGHDRETRLRIARFNGRMCRFLSLQDLTVICPTISLFHEVQQWNRAHVPGYVEILLDVPIEVLRSRDPKGIYARAAQGNLLDVVGLDIVAEFPQHPDLRFTHSPELSPTSIVDRLIHHIGHLTDRP